MPSPGPATPSPLTSEDFLHFFSSSQKILPYTDFSLSITHRVFDPSSHSNSHIFNKIISPYSSDAFNYFLHKHKLSHLYPSLVPNLLSGFPIGSMPNMLATTIIPNHSSCDPFMNDILSYLAEKVHDGRMSGPLSRTEVESTLRGPFYSSPLLVSVQPQAPGTPDKIRMCKNLSKGTKSVPSVNSHILKTSFPTHFDTMSRVADILSFAILIFTIHNSQFTIHNSQFTIHNSLFTIPNSQFTIHLMHCFARLRLLPRVLRHVPLILPNSTERVPSSRITSLGL